MSEYITGELVRVGNYSEDETPHGETSLACAVVAMDREQIKLVRALPMYDNVAIIRTAELETLQRENAALREDKERLDYMEKNVDFVSWMYCGKPHSWDFRKKIDAKRKEAQP